MINLSLICDGNYFLYRAVFILHRLKTLYGDLETLLLNDYNNMTNAYPFNVIYFVSDSKKSWRKAYYPEYKGKRKKEETIKRVACHQYLHRRHHLRERLLRLDSVFDA